MQSDNLKRWPNPDSQANPIQSDSPEPWPKPESQRPISQPKHTTFSGALRYLMAQIDPGDRLGRTYAQVIACALITRACKGDLRAVRLILERTEGKL